MGSPLDALLYKGTTKSSSVATSVLNRGIQTTFNKMYILDLTSRGKCEIQFIPDNITNPRRATYASAIVIGRNTPTYQYIGGEEKLSMQLDFYADEESRNSVMEKVQWLKSLTANNAYSAPPPRVHIVMGSWFRHQRWIVESVEPRYSNLSRPHGFLPQQAYVDITFCLDPLYNLGWSDIKRRHIQAQGDGSNPINLGNSNKGSLFTDFVNDPNYGGGVIPHGKGDLGSRDSGTFQANGGNNWKQILDRILTRYRLPGELNQTANFGL